MNLEVGTAESTGTTIPDDTAEQSVLGTSDQGRSVPMEDLLPPIPNYPAGYCFCECDVSEPCITNHVVWVECSFQWCYEKWFHLTCVGLPEVPPGKWYWGTCIRFVH